LALTRSPSTGRGLRILLALLVVIGVVSALIAAIPPKPVLVEGTAVAATILNDPGSPAIGPRGADVTIVEFSDYQCAPCKEGEPDFERAVTEDGRVRVIYKDWAALGPMSKAAAETALAADRQGRYLAMHQALLRSRTRMSPTTLRASAIQAGVDWARLTVDLHRDRNAIDAQLSRHAFQAWSLGLAGPPGYLIGPFLIRGKLKESELRRLIGEARHHRADAVRE